MQCIGEAFGLDPSNQRQRERLTIKPATIQSIFDVYLKTSSRSESGNAGQPYAVAGPSNEDKTDAEKLKQTGNSHMSSKLYDQAIESYTQAINLDGTNPVVSCGIYREAEF